MHILLIDDDQSLIEALPIALHRRLPESTVTTALSGQEGLDRLKEGTFDVILTDLLMSGMDGDEFTARIQHVTSRTPVILITGVPERPDEVLPADLFAVVRKPFDVDALVQTILSAIGQSRKAS